MPFGNRLSKDKYSLMVKFYVSLPISPALSTNSLPSPISALAQEASLRKTLAGNTFPLFSDLHLQEHSDIVDSDIIRR